MRPSGSAEVNSIGVDRGGSPHSPAGDLWRSAVRTGLGLWLASWLCLQALALLVTTTRPPITAALPSGWRWPFAVYARGDAGHFIRIAQHGVFSRGMSDPNAAFFPGYPGLGRLVADAVGLGRVTSSERLAVFAILAWLGAAAASVLLWRWIASVGSRRSATFGVVAMLWGPYSLFFVASYSESTFLALALAAWLCGRSGRWYWAGVLAGLAALVRINGLFLFGGLAVMYVLQARSEGRRVIRPDLATLPAPLAAAAGYLWWLKEQTGHWDTWFRAQEVGWQRRTTWPWTALHNSVRHYLTSSPNPPLHFQAAMELIFTAIYGVALVCLARRRLWPELTYVGLGVLALMTSTFYQTVPRSMIIAFPLFLLVGEWLATARWKRLVGAVCLSSLMLLVVNVALFTRGYIAG